MNVYIRDFLEGVSATVAMAKTGQDIFSAGNGALFPNITSQAKWKYARVSGGLRLSDGHNVWHFDHTKGESSEEDFPVVRGKDVPIHDFDKDASHVGLAQIHRADPSFIYFTTQEGTSNPTFTYRHEGGDKWRGIPKKRVAKKVEEKSATIELEPAEFLAGVRKTADLGTFLSSAVRHIPRALSDHPVLSAGAGALAGGAYDLGLRHFYNTDEENKQEDQDPMRRVSRWAIPALALGGAGLIGHQLGFSSPQGLGEKNIPMNEAPQKASEPPAQPYYQPSVGPDATPSPAYTLPQATVPAGTPADSPLWQRAGITPMAHRPLLGPESRPYLEQAGKHLHKYIDAQSRMPQGNMDSLLAQQEESRL